MISKFDLDVFNAERNLWYIRCGLWFNGIRLNPSNEIPPFPEFPSMSQPEAENMIDKLDKWIHKQHLLNIELPPPIDFADVHISQETIDHISEVWDKMGGNDPTKTVYPMKGYTEMFTLPPDSPELPPLPESHIFITQTELDRKIKNAIDNEREACAKLCELTTNKYYGHGFAKLIRERSDD